MRGPRQFTWAPATRATPAPSPKSPDEMRFGDRQIVVLQRQRAQLDRDHGGHLVRKGADVIGGSRHACGTSHTPEPENRYALQVQRELHAVDQARVDRGAGDAGDRHEEHGAERIM